MAGVDRNPLGMLEQMARGTVKAASPSGSAISIGMDQFSSQSHGPGIPMTPYPLDDLVRGGVVEPRLTEYLPGWNYPMTPGTGKLLPFPVLRALSRLVLPARKAIQIRQQEIAIQAWDIVLKPKFHDKSKTPDMEGKREELLKFFSYPDPYEGRTFADWIRVAVEEVDVIDALAVYLRPTLSPRGGAFNKGVGALSIIDGSTIKPLRDIRGGRPQPPAPAYQQYLYGAPRVNLFAGESVIAPEGDVVGSYSTNELIYRPFNQTAFDMYGFSNLEAAVQEIKLWIDRGRYHQSYFDASDIPGMFIEVPKEWSGTQLEEYEQRFNRRLAGDPKWRHRVKMIPGGTGVHLVKPVQYDMEFDEHLIRLIAMAFDVTPEELGISPKAAGLGGAGWANMAEHRQIRLSLKPRLLFFAELFNFIIQKKFGIEEFMFQWINLDQEDVYKQAQADVLYVEHGIRNRNEIREDRGWDAVEIEGADELLVTTRQGTLPLQQVMAYGRAMDGETGEVQDTTREGDPNAHMPAPPPKKTEDPVDRKEKPATREAIKMAQTDELRRWHRLLKSRGILTRPFASDILPDEFRDMVETLANHIPPGVSAEKWRVRLFKCAMDAVSDAQDDELLDDYPLYQAMFAGPEEDWDDGDM